LPSSAVRSVRFVAPLVSIRLRTDRSITSSGTNREPFDTLDPRSWTCAVFANAGARRVRTPLLAPDANAFIESYIGTLKRECLNHFLCFSLGHLDHILREYVQFYNAHRPHQGLGNRTLPEAATGPPEELTTDPAPQLGRVRCQRFLGGLLRHYYHAA
jgi:putative transposase